MPCEIGFKSYSRIEIPVPQPQSFTERSEAPAIDADLLEKLGIEDSEFLEWVQELGAKGLLEEALKRTLKAVPSDGIDFVVNDECVLEARGTFTSDAQKQKLKTQSSRVTSRWQLETLGIVAELLNYRVTITQKGDEMILEAEEEAKTHPCDYIKITKKGDDVELVFEHFKSRKELDVATAKFLSLADKLGVKINLRTRDVKEGDPFPSNLHHAHDHTHHHEHDHTHDHTHKH